MLTLNEMTLGTMRWNRIYREVVARYLADLNGLLMMLLLRHCGDLRLRWLRILLFRELRLHVIQFQS